MAPWSRLVATGQSGDRSPHSKKLTQFYGAGPKTVEARTRSPLRIRASNKVIDLSIGDHAHSQQNLLEPTILVADFVSVDGRSRATGNRTDYRTLLATD